MLTITELNNMDANVYRENLKDPAFMEAVNRLNTQAAPPPAPVVETVEPVVEPAAPAAEPVIPESRYEYQPTDEQGRPLGGKQVIKYTTQEDFAEKFAAQNTLLIRQLRKVNREHRLGIAPEETVPDASERFNGDLLELKPKSLTVDERFQLAQDLTDPEKFTAARDKLIESGLGIPLADLAKAFNEQKMATLQVMAKQNFDIFAANTPDFLSADVENRQNLTDWMFKKGLAPTVENFQAAYSSLKSVGLLNEAPIVRSEPVPVVEPAPKAQEPVVAEVRIDPTPQPQPKRHSQIPSGLNDRVSSAAGPAPVDASLTLADIDKMTPDDYKAKIKDPRFAKLVNDLEQAALLKRRQRLGQV
jgi:hypothetical protein